MWGYVSPTSLLTSFSTLLTSFYLLLTLFLFFRPLFSSFSLPINNRGVWEKKK